MSTPNVHLYINYSNKTYESVEVFGPGDASKKFATGDRVSEVRFADRIIKYSEISLPELQAERDRLLSLVPGSSSRVRPMIYRGL